MSKYNLKDLIEALETVQDKNKQVYFGDTNLQPQGFCSWRGSYSELCLDYQSSSECYDQMLPTCKTDNFGGHDCDMNDKWEYTCGVKSHSTKLELHTVRELIDMCRLIEGKYFVGYKGGDFTMDGASDIWISTYGCSSGYKDDGVNYSQVIVGVEELTDKVILKTVLTNY